MQQDEGGGKMLVRCYRGKLSVWAALCVLVLGWFYIYPGYKLPQDKEIVEEVLRQGDAWQKNQTGIDLYRLVSGITSHLCVCQRCGPVHSPVLNWAPVGL